MDPLIIPCAVTGSADPDPQRRQNLPITPEQIVDRALAACAPIWRTTCTRHGERASNARLVEHVGALPSSSNVPSPTRPRRAHLSLKHGLA